MSKIASLVLIGFLATCGSPPSSAGDSGEVAAPNLVPNHDFELTSSPSSPPDMWATGPIKEGGAVHSEWGSAAEASGDSATGHVSVKLHGGASGGLPVSVMRSGFFALQEDGCYTLDVMHKGNGGGGSSLVALQMYDVGHSYVGQAVAFSVEHALTAWERTSRDGRAWGNGTRYGQVVLYGSVTTGSDVVIDSVSVTPRSPCDK